MSAVTLVGELEVEGRDLSQMEAVGEKQQNGLRERNHCQVCKLLL